MSIRSLLFLVAKLAGRGSAARSGAIGRQLLGRVVRRGLARVVARLLR